jgi:hypothetical protein
MTRQARSAQIRRRRRRLTRKLEQLSQLEFFPDPDEEMQKAIERRLLREKIEKATRDLVRVA